MSRRWFALISILAVALLAALPALAQTRRGATLSPSRSDRQVGATGQVFVPGFGFRPIIQGRDSSSGFRHGNRFRSGTRFGFRSGFGGFFGGFNTGNSFGYGYVPFYQSYQSYQQTPTVIVVQQPAQSPASARVISMEDSRGAIVVAGLPENWDELNLEEGAPRRHAPAGSALTLLALKGDILFPVTEYWLEDGLVFYVTSTGRQGSVPLRDLDWEMTSRLNAERGQEFVLRSR